MDVSSVKTPPVQPAQPPKRTEKAQQAQSQTAQRQEAEAKKTSESKPVVNTQGQTTGRLLNVTA